jgi:multiple sugar transport system substrate-binding protein
MGKEKRRDGRSLSRREFLRIAGLAGAGVVAAACAPAPTTEAPKATEAAKATEAPKPTEAPTVVKPAKQGLAAGKIGGPTGFEGAERYQYGPDDPAGRAMAALQQLPADKKPEKLVVMHPSGAVGHWNVPFPEGAPTSQQVFEEETGIKLDVVSTNENEQFQKIIQDTTTKAAQYDVYSFWGNNRGTLAEAGAFFVLDDFVAQYKPEWEKYYEGGQLTVESYAKYAGKYVCVCFDGDYQSWNYRKDLFEDPKEQADFKAKYGWDLQWPETWEQLDQLAEFFHRPDQNLLGCTDIRNSIWGLTNWVQRYASFANPAMMYFDPQTGKPMINSEAGVKATQEYADTMKFKSPDAVSWGWPEQYANMAAGGTAITCAFPNMPKFLDNAGNPDSKIVGKLRTGLAPGRIVDGKLIRRTVWWPNITLAVSTQTKYPEAAYLFLQWAGSASMFTFMVGNPAGYYDPFQVSDFKDPVVVGSYHEYHVPTMTSSIEHSVPPLNLNGASEYETALDNNVQAVISGKKTAEQAMADCEKEWETITDRLGRDKQVAAIAAQVAAYSTVVDTPKIKMG